MSEEQLKGYFSFSEADLQENRNGKLSVKQIKKIKANDDFAQKFVIGLCVVFLGLGLLFAYLAVSQNNSVALWVWAGLFWLGAGWALRGTRTQVDSSVQKTEGEVQFVKVEKQTGTSATSTINRQTVSSYEMRVGGETFVNVNPALIEHMQGSAYTVYFTKATRQILSVELSAKGK
ncbi:MAG: hypothetical protein IT310_04770 [Anaerolineales bacterium]|nr:hypothetical protein [Anaerolineales bacterium]